MIVGVIVILDGLIKQSTPGSLIEPAATYLFPANWLTLPLSFGLLMSPWGGHSVFPNVIEHPTALLINSTHIGLIDLSGYAPPA